MSVMAKYNITKTKKLKFARYGGLSSVNQEGYTPTQETFHSPPASRGFYCFVWPYCESFLLGGSWTCWPWKVNSKFTYIRDKEGNVVTDKHPDWESVTKGNKVFSIPTKNWNKNQDARPDYDSKLPDEEFDRICAELDKDWEDNHKDEPKWMFAKKPSPKIFEFDGNLWHHLSDKLKQFQILKRHGSWVKSSVEDYRVALEKEMHDARSDEMVWMMKHKQMPSAKSPFRFYSKDHLECFIEKV